MSTRINLCPNPACKFNATGWFGPSGWARSAAAALTDGFNRPDSATSLGTADSGQIYEPQGGSVWGIAAGKAYTTSATSVTVLAETGLNNGEFTGKITFGAGGTLPGLVFRALDNNNRLGIFLDTAANSFQLWKADAGSSTTLASSSQTLDPDIAYTVLVVANGTSITGYLDGTAVLTHTLAGGDATKYVSAGYTKVGWRGSTEARFDDLRAATTGGGLDPSLPRATGFKGTTVGGVISPKFSTVPAAQYVASVSIHAIAAQAAEIGIDWYASGVYHSSTASTAFSAGAGATVRPEVGPVTAPSGVDQGIVTLDLLDGSAEVTALLVEQTSATGGAYFDGDSAGASWAGTSGGSISYLLTGTDTFTFTDSGSLLSATPGPVGGDALHMTESAGVVAAGTAVDEFTLQDSGLILALGYDDTRGRVRVDAFGLPATAVRAEVYSRPVTAARFTLVRGGRVTVTDGTFTRPVDDYEFVAGAAMVYRVVALSTPVESPDVVVATAEVTRPADPLAAAWIKFIAAPFRNRKIRLTGWGQITRSSRNATYDVAGRSEPVVVTDVHGSRHVTIEVRTSGLDEMAELDTALSQGAPIFLHTPVTIALPSLYAAVGDYSYDRPSARSHAARWTIPLIEVAAPPPSVVGAGVTYQTVLDQFVSYQELLDQFVSYQEVAS